MAAHCGVPACSYQRRNCGVRGEEAATRGIAHGGEEVVAGHGLAVVALEVKIHALAESLLADQRFHHADDLRALFIHRGGVEVVDLHIRRGPHRMRHGAGILGELGGAQGAHFLNLGDVAVVHVLAKASDRGRRSGLP